MRRILRKDTIFRLYLFAFTLLLSGGFAFVYSAERRNSRFLVDRLESRIVELEARMTLASSSSSASPETTLAKVVSEKPSPPLFYVLGHGFNGKWAYLDIEFNDGFWERFYFRPFPKKAELVSLHRRIEHDALKHFYVDLGEES